MDRELTDWLPNNTNQWWLIPAIAFLCRSTLVKNHPKAVCKLRLKKIIHHERGMSFLKQPTSCFFPPQSFAHIRNINEYMPETIRPFPVNKMSPTWAVDRKPEHNSEMLPVLSLPWGKMMILLFSQSPSELRGQNIHMLLFSAILYQRSAEVPQVDPQSQGCSIMNSLRTNRPAQAEPLASESHLGQFTAIPVFCFEPPLPHLQPPRSRAWKLFATSNHISNGYKKLGCSPRGSRIC